MAGFSGKLRSYQYTHLRALEMTKITCQRCNGSGVVTIQHPNNDPQLDRDFSCGFCNGTGEVEPDAEAVENLIAFVRDAIKMNQFDPGMLIRAERTLKAFKGE